MYLLRFNKTKVLCFLMLNTLLACVTCFAQSTSRPKLDLNWVFITNRLTWTAPPKDPELPKYETASANIVVFYPSGEFVDSDFWVGRDKRGMFILPGEGFAVRRGHWSRIGNQIFVKSQLSYSEKMGVLSPPKGSPSFEETWIAKGRIKGRMCARLIAPSTMYLPLDALQNLGEFNNIINEPTGGPGAPRS